MTSSTPLRGDLERSAYRSRWRDGSVDLLVGIGIMAVGLSWVAEVPWAVGFAPPVLVLVWVWIRRRILEPRIGRVTFSSGRRDLEKATNIRAIILGVALLGLFLVLHSVRMKQEGGFDAWLTLWIAALPGSLLAVMAVAAGVMLGLIRFVGYAAVLLGISTLATRAGWEPGPQILLAGGIISLLGLALFIRFLSTHHVPADRADYP